MNAPAHAAIGVCVEEFEFPGGAGVLRGRSVKPADPAAAWATLAFVHGYGDHSGRYAHVFGPLAEAGVACVALDLRGQGRSDGRRGYVRQWEDYLDDLRRFLARPEVTGAGSGTRGARGAGAVGARRERLRFLMGHSHGGLIVAAHCLRETAAGRMGWDGWDGEARRGGEPAGAAETGEAWRGRAVARGGNPRRENPRREADAAERREAGRGETETEAAWRGVIFSAPFFASALHVPRYLTWLARLLNPVCPWLPFASGVRGHWLCADAQMIQSTLTDPLSARVATPRWFLTHQVVQRAVLARAGEWRLPLLMMLGEADPIAAPAGGRAFYERAASADKTLRVYPGLLHEIFREREREIVVADLLGWLQERRGTTTDGHG